MTTSIGVRGTGHMTVFTANTAHPTMHKLHGYSCATKNGVEWLYSIFFVLIRQTLVLRNIFFEFQVFTGVYKAVFKVHQPQLLGRHVWQCLGERDALVFHNIHDHHHIPNAVPLSTPWRTGYEFLFSLLRESVLGSFLLNPVSNVGK